jgi:hypothetical protein
LVQSVRPARHATAKEDLVLIFAVPEFPTRCDRCSGVFYFDGLDRQHSCISIRVFDRLLIAFHVEVFVKQRDAEAFSLPMLLQNLVNSGGPSSSTAFSG